MLLMSKEEKLAFTYFEAKPKRGNAKIVREKIWFMMDLFAEIFDKDRRNCTFHPETKGGMWTVLIMYESEEAKALLDQDPRFQEAMTDLQAYCKPAHRLKRMIHFALHPDKPFAIDFKLPVAVPSQDK
jgi:hypothetical protein